MVALHPSSAVPRRFSKLQTSRILVDRATHGCGQNGRRLGRRRTLGGILLSSIYLKSAEASTLRERLEKRRLDKAVFNRIPGVQEYPSWMEGTWEVQAKFEGFEFPSSIPKSQLVKDVSVPGFQKVSVAYIPDIDRIVADLSSNLRSIINSYTQPGAVENIAYDARKNPNRVTIDLRQGITRNAARIELFTNGTLLPTINFCDLSQSARESELTNKDEQLDTSPSLSLSDDGSGGPSSPLFITSESIRQVNLGYGEYKRSKELVLDYQLLYTFNRVDASRIDGTISTVGTIETLYANDYCVFSVMVYLKGEDLVRIYIGYIQPNEAMVYSGQPMVTYSYAQTANMAKMQKPNLGIIQTTFFTQRGGGPVRPDVSQIYSASTKPVVLYSHKLTMKKIGD
eukprot:jgi/Bigna1/86714/estExt_fgenesh1_pg.C_130039